MVQFSNRRLQRADARRVGILAAAARVFRERGFAAAGMRDIAIAGGRIAAVEATITGDAADTIDAHGKIVTAGLIDIHTHAGRSKEGPPMLL